MAWNKVVEMKKKNSIIDYYNLHSSQFVLKTILQFFPVVVKLEIDKIHNCIEHAFADSNQIIRTFSIYS